MKKNKKLLVGFLAILGLISLFGYWLKIDSVKAAVSIYLSELAQSSHNATSTYAVDKGDGDGGYLTSTSTTWLIPGDVFAAWEGAVPYPYVATSTIQIPVEGYDYVTIGLQMVSSSTASNVSFETQVSFDGSIYYDWSPNDVFNTSNANNFSDGMLFATSTLLTYAPSNDGGGSDGGDATSTPAFTLNLKSLAAKSLRLKMGAGGATSTVRMQIFRK